VVRALAHALSSDTVTIEVASTNTRAISLYERIGFVKTKELSRWYQIF
jgi:ribosomal protein S18 acetylase RimI-like enzyme